MGCWKSLWSWLPIIKKGCDNFLITCLVFYSPLKVAPSADYASLAFFSSYDEEAILKVNAKIDGDVMISVFHARQTNLLFANKFDKILICRLYFHTGFLGPNSSSLRFKLRDMDLGHQGQTSPEFKVVVNFRPEKDVKSMPLKCQNADLSLLFGTKDDLTKKMQCLPMFPTFSVLRKFQRHTSFEVKWWNLAGKTG
mgnify:CR=1 FL=1